MTACTMWMCKIWVCTVLMQEIQDFQIDHYLLGSFFLKLSRQNPYVYVNKHTLGHDFFQNGFLQYPILVSLDFHYTSSWRPNETFYSRFSKNIDIWLRNYFFENRLFQFLAVFDKKRKQKCSFLAIIFEKMNKKTKNTVEPNKILWETRWWKKNFKNFHDLYSKKKLN